MKDPIRHELAVLLSRILGYPCQVILLTMALWAIIVTQVYPLLDLHAQWAMYQHAVLHPLAHINALLVISLCLTIAILVVTLEYVVLYVWWRGKGDPPSSRPRRGARDIDDKEGKR